MYIHGSFTGDDWPAIEMSYSDGKWLSPEFSCADGSAFKIETETSNWTNGNIWGRDDSTPNQLILSDGDTNVSTNCTTPFKISVDEKTMTWELVAVQ